MFSSVEVIGVSYNGQKVGRLVLTPDRRCLFEYDTQWINEGFTVSPFYLPLKSGAFTAKTDPFDGLFGVFNDSLPDGWGLLLMDRWLRSKGIEPKSLSVLDRLSLVGDNGMGALAYSPVQYKYNEKPLETFDFYAAESRKTMLDENTGSLEALIDKAGSSGGARPKVLVNFQGKDWIVKFRSSVDPADVGETEYYYSLLAVKCGIEMPETKLFEGRYFGALRFDKIGKTRIHVHSAAGLLYASHRLPSLDYCSLLKATLALTKDITELGKMFRLMVFNVLIGNMDDHSRNFSFIFRDNKWQVSPAYDLLPSFGFNGNHTTTINGKGKATISDCLKVAEMVSFPLKSANLIVDHVIEGIKTR
jgi:serine/threonine-protein kinase HipA